MTDHITPEEISAHLDREETETPGAQIEEHLKACPGCSGERERLRAVKRLVARSAETHTAPVHLLAGAFSRLGQQHERTGWRERASGRRMMVPAFAALFIIAVVVVGTVYMTPEGWRISCGQCLELLPEYIANTLPAEQEHMVSAHLDVCQGCHLKYDEMLKEARLAMSGLDASTNPADLPRASRRLRPGPRIAWVREEPSSS